MQYNLFTVSVEKGSNIVQGATGTKFLSKVSAGNSFKVKGDPVVYQIASVDSDTQLSLSTAFAGTTAFNVPYQITTDFTPNFGLAEINVGDQDWPTHLTVETIRKIDEILGYSLGGITFKGTWNALTNNPALPLASAENLGWLYRISVAGGFYNIGDDVISNGSAWVRIAQPDMAAADASEAAASSAAAASASASAAATSEATVADSAAAALASASAAATSEANALAHKNDAADSATAADVSELNAANSAFNAATSASAAATSETNAAASATAASGSATAANASQLAAATSETNAADFATAAALSATDANDSEAAALAYKNAASLSAQAASASAADAATSETNAASSAAAALASKNAAATSETNAGLSAASATASKNAAATSETNAAGSAFAAATFETNAAGSVFAAATSETNAAGSAFAAATSEANAATSEANAATSEANASTSASAAATSEANASTSASAAATSEANASTSASAAATSATNAAGSATSADTSRVAAEAARDAALTALDNFTDKYLGEFATDPVTDNDGNPLVVGTLYFNTQPLGSGGGMKVYSASGWLVAYSSLDGALLTANNLSDLANAATARVSLGLANVENTALSTWGGSANITTLGTIGSGLWNGSAIGSAYGGTGVNNGTKTITLGGNLTTSGAFATTLAVTGTTNVTLPTSGTLAVNNQTMYIGTTQVAINRASGALTLTGTSIDGNAATATKTTHVVGGVVGSVPYQTAADATSLLAPNTSTTKKFMAQTGTGTAGAAPTWVGIDNADLPAAFTNKTYNGLSLTAAATGFTVAGGTTSTTLTVNNSLGLSGTDGSTLNIGSGGTLGTAAFTASTAYAASSHTHGNITNAGAIGSTSGLPIITTTSGVLTAGSFGSSAGTFCQGNDSRLSDARQASDVYAWAKAATKPSYSYSEVGAAASSHTHSYAGSSSAGGAATSALSLSGQAAVNGSDGWFRSTGACGWYSETYAGGVYMTDTTWVRTYNNRALYVANDIVATGNVTAYYSDERLKTRLGNIGSALEKVCALNGFTYVNNDLAKSFGYTKEDLQLGLSAQEVRAVAPEVVSLAPFDMQTDEFSGEITSKSGENYLTVDYARLVPLLIEAIKEQQSQIEELKQILQEVQNGHA